MKLVLTSIEYELIGVCCGNKRESFPEEHIRPRHAAWQLAAGEAGRAAAAAVGAAGGEIRGAVARREVGVEVGDGGTSVR